MSFIRKDKNVNCIKCGIDIKSAKTYWKIKDDEYICGDCFNVWFKKWSSIAGKMYYEYGKKKEKEFIQNEWKNRKEFDIYMEYNKSNIVVFKDQYYMCLENKIKGKYPDKSDNYFWKLKIIRSDIKDE